MFKLSKYLLIKNENERNKYLLNTINAIDEKLIIKSDYIIDKDENTNPIDEIYNILNELAKYETHYIDTKDKIKILPRIFLTVHFINEARKSIKTLSTVNKDNKKISYYESNKNASIDDLIKLYESKLEAIGEHKISTTQAKEEVKTKLFISKLKKIKPLSFNSLFFMLKLKKLKKSSLFVSKDTILLFNDIFSFFGIGHTTTNAIHKSIAIYIYELFKNTSIKKEELYNHIENLFIYSFGLDKYTNFKNFSPEYYYVKNIIDDFLILDTNKQKKLQQIKEFELLYVEIFAKNSFLFNIKFIKKIFVNKLKNNHLTPIEKALCKYFGEKPKTFSFINLLSDSNPK